MIIHYCWFGRGEKPEKIKYCIASWKKICPNAEIKEWNEDNYPLDDKCIYVRSAYEQKKYAFVSDYARNEILYKYGGVYLDTDVELLKDITPLTEKPFMAMERAGQVATGLIMNAHGGEPVIREILDYYEAQEDFNINKTVVQITSDILTNYGLKIADEMQSVAGFEIYPTEYFNPKGADYGKEKITENTYAIHHYLATWKSPIDQKIMEYKVRYGVKKGKILFTICHPILALKKFFSRNKK